MGYSDKISRELAVSLDVEGFPSKEIGEPKLPTYGEAFDWLANKHKIVITLFPWPTFALVSRTAYSYTISYYDEETAKFNRKECEDMGSFGLMAEEAIKEAIKELRKK